MAKIYCSSLYIALRGIFLSAIVQNVIGKVTLDDFASPEPQNAPFNQVSLNSIGKMTFHNPITNKTDHLFAVPSLFGSFRAESCRLIALDSFTDACTSFQLSLPSPSDPPSDSDFPVTEALIETNSSASTSSSLLPLRSSSSSFNSRSVSGPDDVPMISDDASPCWYGLVKRGHCPFYFKVGAAQKAGLSGLIIYNDETNMKLKGSEALVRMTADENGNQIRIPSYFLNYRDGVQLRLLAFYALSQVPNVKSIHHAYLTVRTEIGSVNSFEKRSLLESILLVLIFASCLTSILLLASVLIYGVRNVYVYGRFFVDPEAPYVKTPRLKLIPFPLKTLTAQDLERGVIDASDCVPITTKFSIAGSRRYQMRLDCCPICIDEFQVGSQIRVLPCRHCFHSECVDPWLLKHTRLCPVCKRDVLKDEEATQVQKTASFSIDILTSSSASELGENEESSVSGDEVAMLNVTSEVGRGVEEMNGNIIASSPFRFRLTDALQRGRHFFQSMIPVAYYPTARISHENPMSGDVSDEEQEESGGPSSIGFRSGASMRSTITHHLIHHSTNEDFNDSSDTIRRNDIDSVILRIPNSASFVDVAAVHHPTEESRHLMSP